MKWNLDHILSKEEFDDVLQKTHQTIKSYRSWKSRLTPGMKKQAFLRFLDDDDHLCRQVARLRDLPHLMESANQKDAESKGMRTKAEQVAEEFEEASEGFWQWLQGIEIDDMKTLDPKNAKRLFSVDPTMEPSLKEAYRERKHKLTVREENIIRAKDTYGVNLLKRHRDHMEGGFTYDIDGPGKSEADILPFRSSKDPEKRAAFYETLFTPYKENLETFHMILSGVVNNWRLDMKLRKYPTPLSLRNDMDDISDRTIKTMLDTCEEHMIPIFMRHSLYRAQQLGKERLHRYDLFAPIGEEENPDMNVDQALDLILEIYGRFSPEFRKKAQMLIEADHIDAEPRKNKEVCEYCWVVAPGILPYISATHSGKRSYTRTLIHEMGHGIQGICISDKRYRVHDASLALHETASIFSEHLFDEYLYEQAQTKEEKKAILSRRMLSAYNNVLRHYTFTRWEQEAHANIPRGISAERLVDKYLHLTREHFGGAVIVPDHMKYEAHWMPQPATDPFYCSRYPFGYLLSLAFLADWKKDPDGFPKRLESIISAGGSNLPHRLLKAHGYDITSENIWKEGFQVISSWQDELERL